jgi:hypothetical protein
MILVMMGLNRNSYESSSMPSFRGTFTAKYLHPSQHAQQQQLQQMLSRCKTTSKRATTQSHVHHLRPHSLARAYTHVSHISCARKEVVTMLVEGHSHDAVCNAPGELCRQV